MKNLFKTKIIILLFIYGITSIFIHDDASAISISIKATQDYRMVLTSLRRIEPMINNFNNTDNNRQYKIIREKFQAASEKFYGRQFSDSVKIFKNLKINLILLLNKISHEYLIRNKEILDSTAKDSLGIIIDFSKFSTFATYFKRAYNPLTGVTPYTKNKTDQDEEEKHGETSKIKKRTYGPEDYHFFKDKVKLESYLNRGYRKYQFSKNIFNNYDMQLILTKIDEKKKINNSSLNFAINNYLNIIKYCRISNQYGIEIYKIYKIHKFGEILRRRKLTSSTMSDIFDDRIPEKFKVDAIDNKSLSYDIEKKKLNDTEKKAITDIEIKRLQSTEEIRKKEVEEAKNKKSSDE